MIIVALVSLLRLNKGVKHRRSFLQITQEANPIARFVRTRRRQLRQTQEVFAKRCGVGLAFLKRLEIGDEDLRFSKVLQVVRFLGADLIPIHQTPSG